jgi:hypothetical protein
MITDQMKAKSDNFWKMYDQLFSMQLEVLVRHSGSRLSFEVEPDISNLPFDKVYYISKNGTKVHVFSKDILDQAYDEGRHFLYMLGYEQAIHSSLKKGVK